MKQREELEMWRSMYLRLFHGVEQAVDALVEAERACEEIYVSAVPEGRPGAGTQTREDGPSEP